MRVRHPRDRSEHYRAQFEGLLLRLSQLEQFHELEFGILGQAVQGPHCVGLFLVGDVIAWFRLDVRGPYEKPHASALHQGWFPSVLLILRKG